MAKLTKAEVSQQMSLPLTVPEDRPHSENPFLNGFRVPVRGRKQSVSTNETLGIVDMQTGIVQGGGVELVQRTFVDSEQFLKVFRAQIGFLFGLSAPAIKVLAVAWIEAGGKDSANRDYILLSEHIAADHAAQNGHTISRATFFRGRKELIERGIIAPSREAGRYWINPAVFYNGDRVTLVQHFTRAPQYVGPTERFDGDPDLDAELIED